MKLARFLARLKGETVTVELKNGTVIYGTIQNSDLHMNIQLLNVKMTVKQKEPISMDAISVRGNSVRMVILPDSLPLERYLVDDTPGQRPQRKSTSSRRGRGGGPTMRGRGSRGSRGRGRGR